MWTQWFCCYFTSNGYVTWAPTLYMKMGGLPAKYALARVDRRGRHPALRPPIVFAFSVDQHGRKPWFGGGFAACAAVAPSPRW